MCGCGRRLHEAAMSLPEEDLTCPVCCDIFTDPVLLGCSHSFCRGCLTRYWETGQRECPVCRKRASKCNPPSNLALRNVCEAVLLRRLSCEPAEDKLRCNQHREELKLFCLVDKQPICVVCQASKLHKSHDCSPIEEAARDCKDELAVSLKGLQTKLDSLTRIGKTSAEMFKYIKSQSLETQRVIKCQFEELHRVLYEEESSRLAAVKKEEEDKIVGMTERVKEISAEVLSLTDTITVIQEQLNEEDMVLLTNFKDVQERCSPTVPDNMSGALIDVTNHLCNLKYRIWEKMLEHVDYTPVTLDPNTAHPCLILSDDLTSLHYTKQPSCCPDNPERFHMSAEAVGSTSLGSGSHHWVVETGSNEEWMLGVIASSTLRNADVSARPENGFWTLSYRDEELRAMTSPPTPLTFSEAPKQVKVHVDSNKGTVTFIDCSEERLIYSFTHTFTETLLPYFYTRSSQPLRIMPEKVLVTMLRQ
ncbi:zinc-binding protein A33 [Synchiropus splendidus]|uniref:zinc-binding protein A33 n=1 Tax=Synchiropus splendidus TaxID=270530 RepID=UPI00237EDFF6|nr:zinc-binding protein A33 [Synchiropus splendidus]